MWLRGLVFLFLSSCALAQTAAEIDIPALLKEVRRNQRAMNKQISEYTAANKTTQRVYDAKGKLDEELVLESESYQSAKRNVEVVVSKNGKPYSAGKMEKERKEAVKKLTEDELARLAEAQTDANKPGPELGVNYGLDNRRRFRLTTFDLYRSCEFSNARRGEWNGREMIVLDFRPHPEFKPQDRELAPLAHLAGTVWIDAADKVTAKLEAFLAADKERKTVVYGLEYTRMPDGIWLNHSIRLNTTGHPAAFNDVNSEWIVEKRNFQRFTAQASEVKLEAPKPRQ